MGKKTKQIVTTDVVRYYCSVCKKTTSWEVRNTPFQYWEEHKCKHCGQTYRYKI